MIKLKKGPPPQILVDNSATWTKAILEKKARGEDLTATEKGRYNHKEIKEALIKETSGKCAYCESKFRHVTYGDVEHIIPKKVEPELWFSWCNLTIACDVCNTKKGDTYSDLMVDPYETNPDDHFYFTGAFVWPEAGSDEGIFTERFLELNRTELLERRGERLKSLMRFRDSIARTVDPTVKEILEADFLLELENNKEFAAMARDYHRTVTSKQANKAVAE